MKRIWNISLLILFISGITGCKKYLDKQPDDMLTIDMIFSDRTRTEDWLSGVYQSIPSPFWGYLKDQGFNLMGDEMVIPSAWQQWGWGSSYAYQIGNWSPTSGWGPNYWVELPKRIRAAHIFIEKARPQLEKGMDQEMVDRMKNECRFLIAYYYSLMLEIYGPIPFKPESKVENDDPNIMTTQTPVDSIVNWIDVELKNLSTKLPASYSQPDWGHATSIMCLAIRAKTLLFAASPLLNGNPDYKDLVNKNGSHLFSTTYDASKWAKAATAYKELIDAAHAAGHKLYYEYNDDGSIDPFMSYYNMSLKRWPDNKEILFGRPDPGDLNSWAAHHLPRSIGGNGGLGLTQELVDAFFMKNGLPINDPASGYNEQGFSTTGEIRNTKWTGAEGTSKVAGQVTQEGTFNMYCNREPRFYCSVIYNEAWMGVAGRRANFFLNGPDGGPTFDAPQNGYEVRKRVSLDVYPREGKWNYQPGILYRLADAYLGYAEALNESSTGNADILKYINLVRERAGIPKLAGGTQDELREAIRRERRVEFNCEGIRFIDLRRWKLGEQYLNNNMYGMNFNGTEKSDNASNPNAYYKRTLFMKRNFSKKMYFWPVPQTQLDINPNLVQITGYSK